MRILLLLFITFQSWAQFPMILATQNKGATPPDPPEPTPTTGIHVSKTGNDANACTFASPCLTGQRGANVAANGDTVFIHVGTYRETITPPINGITFMPYPGDIVTISGAEEAGPTGWTVHTGNIYKKTLSMQAANFVNQTTTNTSLLANQVYDDGVAQLIAQWPNKASIDDMLDVTKYRAYTSTSSFTNTAVNDSGLPVAAPGLIGASIMTNGWFISQTFVITAHSGTTITHAAGIPGSNSQWYTRYYLSNLLSLLDAQREWFYDGTTLYFYQAGGGSPTGVEYKVRNWGFNLSNRTNTKIIGLKFFACEIMGNTSTSNCVIDGIEAKYSSFAHNFVNPGNDYMYTARQTGFRLLGSNNVFKNSIVAYAEMGVWLGESGRADNNLIHDIGYSGNWSAGLKPWSNSGNHVFTYNTIYRTARACIELADNVPKNNLNVEISHNDLSYSNMINIDGAQIYSFYRDDHTGSFIAWNWFHNNGNPWTGLDDEGLTAQVYFDQASGPWIVARNIFSAGPETDIYTDTDFTGGDGLHRSVINSIYFNTFASTGGTNSYINYRAVKDVQKGNIYRNYIQPSTANITNSILRTTNPLFIGGSGAGQFQLQSGSPARNLAPFISPWTDNVLDSQADAGAIEYNVAAFTFGCNLPECP